MFSSQILASVMLQAQPSTGQMIFQLIIAVLLVASMWKIFTKAGEDGWKCLIPIYSTIVLLKIVGRPWWWLFLFILIIPIFIVVNDLSKSFGKGIGYTIGLIFLWIIFIPMLAFGDAKYVGPGGNAVAVA